MAATCIFAGMRSLQVPCSNRLVLFFSPRVDLLSDWPELVSSKSINKLNSLFLAWSLSHIPWILTGITSYIQSKTWQLDSTRRWRRTRGGTSGHRSSRGPGRGWCFRTVRPLSWHIWGYNSWCMPHRYYVIILHISCFPFFFINVLCSIHS